MKHKLAVAVLLIGAATAHAKTAQAKLMHDVYISVNRVLAQETHDTSTRLMTADDEAHLEMVVGDWQPGKGDVSAQRGAIEAGYGALSTMMSSYQYSVAGTALLKLALNEYEAMLTDIEQGYPRAYYGDYETTWNAAVPTGYESTKFSN